MSTDASTPSATVPQRSPPRISSPPRVIGKITKTRLSSHDVRTLGVHGLQIFFLCPGIDSEPVTVRPEKYVSIHKAVAMLCPMLQRAIEAPSIHSKLFYAVPGLTLEELVAVVAFLYEKTLTPAVVDTLLAASLKHDIDWYPHVAEAVADGRIVSSFKWLAKLTFGAAESAPLTNLKPKLAKRLRDTWLAASKDINSAKTLDTELAQEDPKLMESVILDIAAFLREKS